MSAATGVMGAPGIFEGAGFEAGRVEASEDGKFVKR